VWDERAGTRDERDVMPFRFRGGGQGGGGGGVFNCLRYRYDSLTFIGAGAGVSIECLE
jgi:hypothetical protein